MCWRVAESNPVERERPNRQGGVGLTREHGEAKMRGGLALNSKMGNEPVGTREKDTGEQ